MYTTPKKGETPLSLLIHNVIALVIVPMGWSVQGDYSTVAKMTHVQHGLLQATDRATLSEFMHKITRADSYLINGSTIDGYTPTDEDIINLFTFAYHFLNPEDAIGEEGRQVLQEGLRVLGLGDILPELGHVKREIQSRKWNKGRGKTM